MWSLLHHPYSQTSYKWSTYSIWPNQHRTNTEMGPQKTGEKSFFTSSLRIQISFFSCCSCIGHSWERNRTTAGILSFLYIWQRKSPHNPNLVSNNVDLEENSTCRTTQENFRLQLQAPKRISYCALLPKCKHVFCNLSLNPDMTSKSSLGFTRDSRMHDQYRKMVKKPSLLTEQNMSRERRKLMRKTYITTWDQKILNFKDMKQQPAVKGKKKGDKT